MRTDAFEQLVNIPNSLYSANMCYKFIIFVFILTLTRVIFWYHSEGIRLGRGWHSHNCWNCCFAGIISARGCCLAQAWQSKCYEGTKIIFFNKLNSFYFILRPIINIIWIILVCCVHFIVLRPWSSIFYYGCWIRFVCLV